jgi:hypothetical protein
MNATAFHCRVGADRPGVIISVDPRGAGGIDLCHGQVKRLTSGSTVGFVG